MVEASKMRLVETVPGESGETCVFETVAGDRLSVVRPQMSQEDEEALIAKLRGVLNEEGIL